MSEVPAGLSAPCGSRPPWLAASRSLPACLWLLVCLGSASCARNPAPNPIETENRKRGTTEWKLTKPRCESCDPAQLEIQGYASRTSVNPGDSIDFFVRTRVPGPYTLKIFRVGWYGGTGGRLMGALEPEGALEVPRTDGAIPAGRLPSLAGLPQPIPAPDGDGMIECAWTAASTSPVAIPRDWTSGVYLAKLEDQASGVQSYIVFVVKDDGRPATYLFNSSVATYQAYNAWGGRSLYSTPPAHKVSFNRPYGADYDGDQGAGHLLIREINMVRWMERQGYDVSYSTDVDFHRSPDLALSHRAVLFVGHSEYWSWQMRANAERARDRGVSLGFFSGNSVFWQVRFEPSPVTGELDRTMVGYKLEALSQDPMAIGDDPSKRRYTTALWSGDVELALAPWDPINRPEEMLVGVGYSPSSCDPMVNHFADIEVTDPAAWPSWLSRDTDLSTGAVLPDLLGYEVDAMHGFQPIGTLVLARSTFPRATDCPGVSAAHVPAHMTLVTAPSGALVLATGSIYWDLGLDDYGMSPGDVGLSKGVVPAAQQVTTNFLDQAARIAAVPASARLPAAASTGWEDAEGGARWIQLDFGARRWIQRLRWEAAFAAPYPWDYAIQVSDDADSWQTVVARTSSAMAVRGNEPVNEQGRYLRLLAASAAGGTAPAFGLLDFWAEGAPPPPSGRLKVVGRRGGVLGRDAEAGWTYSSYRGCDLDFATEWVASLTPSPDNNFGWFQVDFGGRRQIDRVRWLGTSGSPPATASPTDYSILVSDDGKHWTRVVDRSHATMVVQGDEHMSAQGRYLRISTTKVGDGTGWSLGFFEFWAEGSDSANVLGAVAAASSEAPGHPAGNAVDGRKDTAWVASLVPSPSNNGAWFRVDFGSRKQIDRVRWHAADENPYPASGPTDYSIQVSDDGSSWQTVLTRPGGLSPVIDGDELLNAQGRYLRLLAAKVGDGTGWALSFREFWAEGY